MITRASLLAFSLAGLLCSCSAPIWHDSNSHSFGPAYGGQPALYARPSHVADHSYPSSFEPVYRYHAPAHYVGGGYGTDAHAQIPYLYR